MRGGAVEHIGVHRRGDDYGGLCSKHGSRERIVGNAEGKLGEGVGGCRGYENAVGAQGEGDMAANPGIKSANNDFRTRHAGLTPEQLESIYYREALAHILAHPVWWVGLLAKKFFFLWVPIGPSYTLHSPLYLWASVVSYGLIFPPAVAGAVALWRQRRTPVSLTVMAGSVVIASLIFFPQERFRIPVLDPTFIICAATWLAGTTTRGRLSQVRTG